MQIFWPSANALTLELEAHAELHYARAAAAESRIPLGHIWSLRDRSCRTGVRNLATVSVDAGVDGVGRQSKVWMIEDIEELRPELQRVVLAELEILSHRKIQVAEAGAIDLVATQITESAVGGLRKGVRI